jgi:CheY-like chemotaxis protein
MSDESILKIGMSQEELEDTIQFSQQMVQVLLETIGEAMGEVEQLRRENRTLRAALEQHGVSLPQVEAPPPAPVPAPPGDAPDALAEIAAPAELEQPAGVETTADSSLPAAPAVPAPSPAPAVPATGPAQTSVEGLGDGVLIVDDSRILQMRLRSLIEPLGIRIAGYATNGAEGIKLAMQLNPRCVIMDYNMPVLNGLEAAKVLHRDAPQIRIIICAADLTATLSRELIASGCTELLTKPIQLDHFVRALKRCMDDKPL